MPLDIVIDTREKEAEYFIVSMIDAGITPKVETLPAGDFLIFGKDEKNSTLIERKTASDFLGSIEGKKNPDGSRERGRIWDQLKRMKESGIKDRWIIIEGNPLNKSRTVWKRKGFTKERLWGSYEAIAKWGTYVLMLKNKEETVEYLIHLIRKKARPKKEFALRASPPKTMTLTEKRTYFLQGLPGKMGPKATRLILKKYGTPRNFFDHLDEIDELRGIGEKTKEDIKEVYG